MHKNTEIERIKTGNLYVVLTDKAINVTNGDTDGHRMVVYLPKDNVTKIYTENTDSSWQDLENTHNVNL